VHLRLVLGDLDLARLAAVGGAQLVAACGARTVELLLDVTAAAGARQLHQLHGGDGSGERAHRDVTLADGAGGHSAPESAPSAEDAVEVRVGERAGRVE